MGSHQSRKAVAVAAFACFFATLPVYSPNIVVLNTAGVPEVTTWFSQGVLAFALVASVLAALAGTRRARHGGPGEPACAGGTQPQVAGIRGRQDAGVGIRRNPSEAQAQTAVSHADPAARTWRSAVEACYLVGGAGYTLLVALGMSVSSPAVNAAGLACALLAGLTTVPLCVEWAHAFSRERLVSLICTAGVGIACAALLNLAANVLPQPLPYVAHVCMLAVGTFAPRLLGKAAGGNGAQPTVTALAGTSRSGDADTPSSSATPAYPVAVRAFLSVMGTPLLGVALSSFVIGIAPTTVLGSAVDTQVLGSIVAGVVLAAACAAGGRGKVPTSTLVQRLIIPVAAALALAACAFPGMGQDGQVIASYTLFSLVGAIALGMGCGISNAQEFPRSLVFSTLVGTYCLTAVLGLAAGSWLSASSYHFEVIVALMAAYGVFAVASACLHAVRPAGDDTGAALEPDPQGETEGGRAGTAGTSTTGRDASASVEALVGLLAQRFSLTPRETEIVGILARGHGCSYVAETLLISKSTVYTHVRNIYRKLDVSNHDGLIAKIYEQG